MKKHGKRMELAGGLGLLWLAMASDAGSVSVPALVLLAALCVSLLLVGDLFTRPRRKRAVRTCRVSAPALRVAPVPRPVGRAA